MKAEIFPGDDVTMIAFAFEPTIDHAQVKEMARVVERAIGEGGDLALLLDMRATTHVSPGTFLSAEGAWVSLRAIGPVRRYAVVAAPAIAAAAVEAFGKVLPLQSRAFEAEEIDAARLWVAEPRP